MFDGLGFLSQMASRFSQLCRNLGAETAEIVCNLPEPVEYNDFFLPLRF